MFAERALLQTEPIAAFADIAEVTAGNYPEPHHYAAMAAAKVAALTERQTL